MNKNTAIDDYTVLPAVLRPEFKGLWDGPAWRDIPYAEVSSFRPEGSDHRPRTRVKTVHSPEGLYGLFQVEDRFVRCVRKGFQAEVYKDSCVEFFVQPARGESYFNFEFNCGGAMLASYIRDWNRVAGGFRDFTRLSMDDCRQVFRFASLPPVVDPEIKDHILWHLEFFIPFALLERYAGEVATAEENVWRGNFFKCGDETSHPHWAAWAPVSGLNFHLPDCFGNLRFAAKRMVSDPHDAPVRDRLKES